MHYFLYGWVVGDEKRGDGKGEPSLPSPIPSYSTKSLKFKVISRLAYQLVIALHPDKTCKLFSFLFFFAADLLSVTSTGQETVGTSSSSSMQKAGEKDVHYIIFIHALQNGLFRIHIQEYEKTQTK